MLATQPPKPPVSRTYSPRTYPCMLATYSPQSFQLPCLGPNLHLYVGNLQPPKPPTCLFWAEPTLACRQPTAPKASNLPPLYVGNLQPLKPPTCLFWAEPTPACRPKTGKLEALGAVGCRHTGVGSAQNRQVGGFRGCRLPTYRGKFGPKQASWRL